MGSVEIETLRRNYHIPVAEKLSEGSKSNLRKLLKGLFVHPRPNGPPLQLGSSLPAVGSFRPYRRLIGVKHQHGRTAAGGFRQVEREEPIGVIRGLRPLKARLTDDIVKTFVLCNPNFRLPKPQKWYLTWPSQGVRNNGQDNENDDLILYHNCVLVDPASKARFQVKNRLGNGAYGQAFRCSTSDSGYPDFVAIKIIKKDPVYSNQARYEVGICKWLNEKDPQDTHHIYRILNHFNYAGHKCLVFELLGMNLYELLAENHMRGLPMDDVKGFTRQILEALVAMGDAGVIHRDLKPENILLLPGLSQIKVIDFGSACMVLNKVSHHYIQSRFYRSPEVLLKLPYTTAIDMWSLGCVAAEIFLGRPLFPAGCPYDLFRFMIDVLGSQPPDNMIGDSEERYNPEFFKVVRSAALSGIMGTDVPSPAFELLSEDEFEAGAKRKPKVGKRPFGEKNLEEMIVSYQIRTTSGGVEKEMKFRESFIHFLKGVLNFDPVKRWTPRQALDHPFITGESLAKWQPPCEEIQSYDGNESAPNSSSAIGGSPQLHFNANAYHLGLHASPDFLKYMLSRASNGSGMGSSSGSLVSSPGPGNSFRGSGESTAIHHIYSNSPGTVVNAHHHGFAGGYAFSPDTYTFRNGQPVNVRPPNNQLGFLGGIQAPSYQLNTFYGSPASSFYPDISNASSVHPSPIWSTESINSIPHSCPSSQSQFSSESQFLISPNRPVSTFPATGLPDAGNSVMKRFSPRSQHEFLRNQHPCNRNMSLMRDAAPRHPNIGNAPGAKRTAHPSSSTRGRVGHLPPALNQTIHSYISEGSEALLISPDLGQWHPRHSCKSQFGEPGEASTSNGRSEAHLFSPDLGQWHPSYNGEQLFGDPGEAPPSEGRSMPEVPAGKSSLPCSNVVPGDAGEASSSKSKSVRQNLTRKSRFGNRTSFSTTKLVSYSTMVAGGSVEASSSSGKDLSYSTMVAGGSVEAPSSSGKDLTYSTMVAGGSVEASSSRGKDLSYSTKVAGDAGEVPLSPGRVTIDQSSGISRLQTAIFRNLSLTKRSLGDPCEASSSSGKGVSEQSTGIPRNLSNSNMVGGQQSLLSGQSRPQRFAEGHPVFLPNPNSNSRGTGQGHGQSAANTGQSKSEVQVLRHSKR